MHRIGIGLLLWLFACLPAAKAQTSSYPVIGSVDFYGLSTIPEAAVRKLLPFKDGDQRPTSPLNSLQADMAASLGVAKVEINFVCCNSKGLSMVYVGIAETSIPVNLYHAAPAGEVTLPPALDSSYEEFGKNLLEAVLRGKAGEDHSQGHALSEYGPLRTIQERFIVFAAQYHDALRQILHDSADAHHRAIAALVLGYVHDKAGITDDLTWAAQDPNDEVRNNATRAVWVIADYGNVKPDLGITIDPKPFINMLNSVVWSDRNKGLLIMSSLTQGRDYRLLQSLREQALQSLIEMCRWHYWGHAAPACMILRRIVGLSDDGNVNSRTETLVRITKLSE